jgi:hypothetical protein
LLRSEEEEGGVVVGGILVEAVVVRVRVEGVGLGWYGGNVIMGWRGWI